VFTLVIPPLLVAMARPRSEIRESSGSGYAKLNCGGAASSGARTHAARRGEALDQLDPTCQHGNAISLLSIGMRFAPDRESEWSLGTRTLTSSMPWWPRQRRRRAASVVAVHRRAGAAISVRPGSPSVCPSRDRQLEFLRDDDASDPVGCGETRFELT
jgi:hypothetical protein